MGVQIIAAVPQQLPHAHAAAKDGRNATVHAQSRNIWAAAVQIGPNAGAKTRPGARKSIPPSSSMFARSHAFSSWVEAWTRPRFWFGQRERVPHLVTRTPPRLLPIRGARLSCDVLVALRRGCGSTERGMEVKIWVHHPSPIHFLARFLNLPRARSVRASAEAKI